MGTVWRVHQVRTLETGGVGWGAVSWHLKTAAENLVQVSPPRIDETMMQHDVQTSDVRVCVSHRACIRRSQRHI